MVKIKIDDNFSIHRIKELLKERFACHIILTCSEPSEDGHMEVEMSYEGDEILASYLLDNAKKMIDQKLDNLGLEEKVIHE